MTVKPEKKRKYYRKYSNNFAADCIDCILKLTSCIQLKDQKIKTLNVFIVMENSPKMNKDKFGLSVSAGLYRSRERSDF